MDFLNAIINRRMWNRHAVSVATVLSVICLVLVTVSISWNAYTESQAKQRHYQAREIAAPTVSRRSGYRVNDIVAANLFGDPQPAPVVKKAPKTTLNLTLQGILWASDSSMARAIIQTGNKASELYSVGESIKGARASVKEIRTGEVLLNRNGATESLPLVKKNISGDRQIITYETSADPAAASSRVANTPTRNRERFSNIPTAKKRAPNGAPRKVRKPNFSGLDQALKKMGEL